MSKTFTIFIQPDPEDGGYVATVSGLPDIVGQGETEKEAFENVAKALAFTLEEPRMYTDENLAMFANEDRILPELQERFRRSLKREPRRFGR
jgi:predicted RNase H-like HicB family nuclease